MTSPEILLWNRLRGRTADRPKFRRQHPFGTVILDFYCPAARLAVEIDGETHWDDESHARDEARDHWLARQGVTVLRVAASAVYRDVGAVADGVWLRAEELLRRGEVVRAARPHHRPLCGGRSPSPASQGRSEV